MIADIGSLLFTSPRSVSPEPVAADVSSQGRTDTAERVIGAVEASESTFKSIGVAVGEASREREPERVDIGIGVPESLST
jgi:hypothetical protein